jgi:hypothetical protein
LCQFPNNGFETGDLQVPFVDALFPSKIYPTKLTTGEDVEAQVTGTAQITQKREENLAFGHKIA